MFKSVKQVRAAVSLVSPDAVRALAAQRIAIGLVAGTPAGYAELEDFLLPADVPHAARVQAMETIYRANDPDVPGDVDLVLCEHGMPCPDGAYSFRRDEPQKTVAEILHAKNALGVPFARCFPAFRRPATDKIVQAVACENALFAIASALPNVVPTVFELPWVIGEFASDTAFLTVNQIRMAFLIAAACGGEIGFANQKVEILAIVGGAFGWRALARELAGKIPMGGGLIPKGAIAYAATVLIGKGLEHYHHAGAPLTREQRAEVYEQAYERGKAVAESLAKPAGEGE